MLLGEKCICSWAKHLGDDTDGQNDEGHKKYHMNMDVMVHKGIIWHIHSGDILVKLGSSWKELKSVLGRSDGNFAGMRTRLVNIRSSVVLQPQLLVPSNIESWPRTKVRWHHNPVCNSVCFNMSKSDKTCFCKKTKHEENPSNITSTMCYVAKDLGIFWSGKSAWNVTKLSLN